ncbi:17502_t:CDS:2, partial [Funneliformis geosporum]
MNGNKLEEFAQEYFVNCNSYRIIITTDLDHECIISYNLRQIHPKMIPETLINEVFWDISEKEKTNSEELISIMDEVYQKNTEVELVKGEISKELIRKGKRKR